MAQQLPGPSRLGVGGLAHRSLQSIGDPAPQQIRVSCGGTVTTVKRRAVIPDEPTGQIGCRCAVAPGLVEHHHALADGPAASD